MTLGLTSLFFSQQEAAPPIVNGEAVLDFDYLLENRLSFYWHPLYRVKEPRVWTFYPVFYLLGMGGYVFACAFRILRVAVEALRLSYTALFRSANFKMRLAVFSGSITNALSAVIGILCPPIAYSIDEKIQAKTGIFHQNTSRLFSCWRSEELAQRIDLSIQLNEISVQFSKTIDVLHKVYHELNCHVGKKTSMEATFYSDQLKILTYWILFQDIQEIRNFLNLLAVDSSYRFGREPEADKLKEKNKNQIDVLQKRMEAIHQALKNDIDKIKPFLVSAILQIEEEELEKYFTLYEGKGKEKESDACAGVLASLSEKYDQEALEMLICQREKFEKLSPDLKNQFNEACKISKEFSTTFRVYFSSLFYELQKRISATS